MAKPSDSAYTDSYPRCAHFPTSKKKKLERKKVKHSREEGG